jgi:hypothetical protein
MNPFTSRPSRRTLRMFMAACWFPFCLCVTGPSQAAPDELGRLFYTPAQRAQLETARANNVTQHATQTKRGAPAGAPAPLRYDGVVIRSDGTTTRWIDGKAEAGASSVKGLKPGQIRADGKVYEPYQVLRPAAPSPSAPDVKASQP